MITTVVLYVSWFAVIFMLAATARNRRVLNKWRIMVRIVFAILILFSISVRTFIFTSGNQLAPHWFGPTIDALFITPCLSLIASSWNSWSRGKE